MAGGAFGGGMGTSGDPYLVEDAADLNAVRNDMTAYYKQVADIDLSVYADWDPIGYLDVSISKTDGTTVPAEGENELFNGLYDGQYFKIENLSISPTYDPDEVLIGYGLFCLIGGVVEKVRLINPSVNVDFDPCVLPPENPTDKQYKDWMNKGRYVGALAGASAGYVTRCTVEGGFVKGFTEVGGLLGATIGGSQVWRCFTDTTVTATGAAPVYWVSSQIVSERRYVAVGGFVGWSDSAFITNCYSRSDVYSTFVPCEGLDEPDASDDLADVGGFVGRTVYHDPNNGYIGHAYAAGIVHSLTAMTRGFSGCQFDTAEEGPGQQSIGSPNIIRCYYDSAVTGQGDDDGWGIPRSTFDMTYPYNEENTYLQWDFVGVWAIYEDQNDGYPIFGWYWVIVIVPTIVEDPILVWPREIGIWNKSRKVWVKKHGIWMKANAVSPRKHGTWRK